MTKRVKNLLDSLEEEDLQKNPNTNVVEAPPEPKPKQQKPVEKSSNFPSSLLSGSLTSKKNPNPINGPKNTSETSSNNMNAFLDQLINKNKNRIVVFGVGGAGCNAINRLTLTTNVQGMTTVAANTDAIHLRDVESHEKVLLGLNLTEGLGAGNDPIIGKAAAEESEAQIRSVISGSDMVFVTTGMGGGTGTGAAPIIAEIAKKEGALVVGICTLPFEMEGDTRARHAMEGLKEFYAVCDTVIVIPNEKLMQLVPNLPITLAFEVADEILVRAVKGIVNLIITPAYVNVDFADIRQVLKQGGSSVIGMGEGVGDNRIDDALRESISNSLLDIQIMDCKAALINITGGPDLSLEEVRKCVQTISQEMGEESEIIWGTHLNPSLEDKIVVTTILSGVSSPYNIEFLNSEEPVSKKEDTDPSIISSIWD